jgi:hypothetical protein
VDRQAKELNKVLMVTHISSLMKMLLHSSYEKYGICPLRINICNALKYAPCYSSLDIRSSGKTNKKMFSKH